MCMYVCRSGDKIMKMVNMSRKRHFLKLGYGNYSTDVQVKASQHSVNSSTGTFCVMVKLKGHLTDK